MTPMDEMDEGAAPPAGGLVARAAQEPPRGAAPEREGEQEGGGSVAAQARAQLEQHVPPELRAPVERLVLAGKKVMFGPETNEMAMAEVDRHEDGPGAGAAVGVAALMSQLLTRVKGAMPVPAIVPAALILLMEALEFLGEAGRLEVTPEVVAEATQDLTGYLMQKLGLDEEKVAQAQAQFRAGPPGGPPPAGVPPVGGGAPAPSRGLVAGMMAR